jgi:hypothetical protein
MNLRALLLYFILAGAGAEACRAGTLAGHVRDLNWYARPTTNDPFGVGYYEYAINANGTNISSTGGADDTDVFGAFQMLNLPAGNYTVASWDNWWRSAYAFNVTVPASGTTADVDVRLKATMWGYPTFWDETGYFEFGQTFVATGPVSMIYLRAPAFTGSPQYTLTIREGGPAGARLGATRTFNATGDQRLIYACGEMPTVAGRTYYLRIRTPSPTQRGVIMQMDPRPDYSDPMPGGCLWLGDGTTLTPYPDQDLGVVIMSDDDGLITNMFHRQNGNSVDAISVGQTFVARGVNLISAAFWLADPTFPTYVVRVLRNGPAGAQIGTVKRGRVARAADPEMIVAWAPGECPLVPGDTYYLEVTREGGGMFNVALINTANPYTNGTAFQNGAALPAADLAGTIMEEESEGSARRSSVQITSDPVVTQPNSNSLTIRWTTSAMSDSRVEYAAEHPRVAPDPDQAEPYPMSVYLPQLLQSHIVTLSNLQAHTIYHYRVSSTRTNWRAAVSRDFVICTRPATSNLLANPSFEEGSGPSPRSAIPAWTKSGSLDIRVSDGSWFGGLKPTNGLWLLEGAVNGSSSDAWVHQRVSGLRIGADCTFSAWIVTAPQENGGYKYDVWQDQGRLIYMRLGIDPTGGTNAAASTVRWTPRLYSHRHYTQLAKTVRALNTNVTVFVSMKGQGGDWHLYALDGCALTQEEIPTRLAHPSVNSNDIFQATVNGRANRSNVVEVGSSLTSWTALSNFLNETGSTPFVDPASGPRRFYRVRVIP